MKQTSSLTRRLAQEQEVSADIRAVNVTTLTLALEVVAQKPDVLPHALQVLNQIVRNGGV